MTAAAPGDQSAPSQASPGIPLPVLVVFRGIGQIVFQEHALTGLLFVLGIALGSPLQAAGIVAGAAIGTAVARALKYDQGQWEAGIYGFNPALVGIATLFFFQPGVVSILLLVAGCALATVVTMLVRTHLPFPTYTAPFIVVTWVVFFLGKAMGAVPVDHSTATPLLANPSIPFVLEASAHGIGQIMFQGTLWAGALFLVGIGLSDWKHAGWVLAGSIVGMLTACFHIQVGEQALDPEALILREQFANIALGLYGYNATLAAVALFLWRKSLIPPLLGMLLCVPLTELFPLLGLPALTAPFVVATWIVLALGCLDGRLFGPEPAKA
jgi:urea transporter